MSAQRVNISFIWQWDLLRQTPGGRGIWKDSIFSINGENTDTDYWVVYEDIDKIRTYNLPSSNTILFTAEPSTIKSYPQGFLDQFALVVSPRRDLNHNNIRFMSTGLPWFTGRSIQPDGTSIFVSNYDSMLNEENHKKTNLISIISSDKVFSKGHQERLQFAHQVKRELGDKVDFFGRGINEFNDKADVLAPYKYHIAIENTQEPDYWTEKLSDAFLNNCYPLYSGCQNIKEYFSSDMLTQIDITHPEQAIRTIKNVINSDLFEQRQREIKKAKMLCLNDYNLFPVINKIISSIRVDSQAVDITLKPQKAFS